MHPEKSSRRALKVKSFTTTPLNILQEFQRQTNSKWSVSYTSLERLRALESEAWENRSPLAAGYTLRRIWTEGGTLYPEWDNAEIGADDMDTLEIAIKLAIETQCSLRASL